MAVEASSNIEFMMMNTNTIENGNVFGCTTRHGPIAPFSATMQTILMNSATMKSDSSLVDVPVSRKRSRGVMNQVGNNNHCGLFGFLGEDISDQIQQHQLDIDHFITQHTENIRVDIEQRRKIQSQRIVAAMQKHMTYKLKSIEVEIDKSRKLNLSLEQRVKSMCVENQIWRDLARTNEVTANALRSNIEQVLAQFHDDSTDNTRSWCSSNMEMEPHTTEVNVECNVTSGIMNRTCKRCGKGEPCVLVLPCRHLCLCTVCGSSVHTCPVCNSIKTASVHVNLESS